MSSTIVLMTRFPEVGKAKTRLVPHLGADKACELHKAMTEFTLKEALKLGVPVEVHYTGGNSESIKHWLLQGAVKNSSNHVQFIPQVQGSLGDKMFVALQNALETQNASHQNIRQKVIIIGSDCPNNRHENLQKALSLLDTYDCVIGPSSDGGYYLIAFAIDNIKTINSQIKALFQDITWGTDVVFEQTLSKVKFSNLNYALLPMLSDVDVPEDIPQKISVIVPTLNEENNLVRLLSSMPSAFNFEIIISDAKSNDKSEEIANKYGVIFIIAEQGRSKQIDAGVSQANGEILLFLHADSRLPTAWDMSIRQVLSNKKHSLGYFHFGIMENFYTKNVIEYFTNKIRCKYFQLPFGDQGLFVRKHNYEQWKLPQVPILEDVFLVKKAKQHGQIVAVPQTLYTSGRRWLKYGPIRTTFMNWCVLLCAKWGMNLESINQAYRNGQNPLWYYFSRAKKHNNAQP